LKGTGFSPYIQAAETYGLLQGAEKVENPARNCEIHTSAAKAGVHPID